MKAIILAAGIGKRLGKHAADRPKSLLKFGDKSLLQRHIEILRAHQINAITIIVGYHAALIKAHLEDYGAEIDYIMNPRFTEGSAVSLAYARDMILDEAGFILMDADVLYDRAMIQRLLDAPAENCFLLDRHFIPGDEPVVLRVDDRGQIIEFRKQPGETDYAVQGESVGFFKFNRVTGKLLIECIDGYLARGANDTPYEEAIRDLVLKQPEQFAWEDVSGIPWIEIDFPEDVERAEKEILPELEH